MSIRALDRALSATIESSGAKFVLVILANFADENGSCFPHIETIAEMTSMGYSTVKKHLEALESDKWIVRKRLIRSDGTLNGYRYELIFQADQGSNLAVDQSSNRALYVGSNRARNNPSLTTSVEDKSSTAEIDPDKDAWTQAVNLLRARSAMSENQARSFFGGLLKGGLRARDLLGAIGMAKANETMAPREYLTKAAEGVRKRRNEPVKEKRVSFV